MTGRKLYETVTCELARNMKRGRDHKYDVDYHNPENAQTAIQVKHIVFGPDGVLGESPIAPPAFDFLPGYEQAAWSAAARRLTNGRR